MQQTIYCSRASLRGSPADEVQEIDRLLVSARRFNAAHGVTGGLIHVAGCFAQVLEGEEAAMNAVLDRIRACGRHHGIVELRRAPIEQRAFPLWSMGFASATEMGDTEVARIFEAGFATPGEGTAEAMLGLILSSCTRAQLW